MHLRKVRATLLATSAVFGLIGAFASCSHSVDTPAPPPATTYFTMEQLRDPTVCAQCHADHFREWSGSMHAYAAQDPVFLAMNKRAQRETNGKLGTFCVQCHAPLAVRAKLTTDGLNLDSIDPSYKGVTCYFCHSVTGINGVHNNPLVLTEDGILRGNINDPKENKAHKTAYAGIFDRGRAESANLCGTCHDVTNPGTVDVERTFVEWQQSLYASSSGPQVEGEPGIPCNGCHMNQTTGTAAQITGAPVRQVHDHSMAAIDVALTPFVEMDAQRALVQSSLDPTLNVKLCMNGSTTGPNVDVAMATAAVGHGWPSGANQDRRAWLELVATANGVVVFQSGVVSDGQPLTALNDPNLWVFQEKMYDAQHKDVGFLWQAASIDLTSLPAPVTNDPTFPGFDHSLKRSFTVPPNVDRITARVRVVPIAFETLDDLIATGDLDPALRAKMPTFTLAGTSLTWTANRGVGCVP